VTTTTDNEWEFAQGNYLIFAESPEVAKIDIVNKIKQRVIAVVDVKEVMKNNEVYTISETVVE
jgi:hypothetical protein